MVRTTPAERAVAVVAADWALRSKHPSRAMGYEVVDASGDTADAHRLIWDSVTGTPDGRPTGGPDELPWLTFVGTVDRSGRARTGLLEFAAPTARDGTGQPIVPARLLMLTWTDAVRVDVTCDGLRQAAAAVRWTGTDGPPEPRADDGRIVLTVPPAGAAALAATVERMGVDWVAAIAGALVDGAQVVITAEPAGFPDLDERVAVFDAVCALLPFGCRSWVTASTWAVHLTPHEVRLTFALRARVDQWEIRAGSPPARPPGDVGRAYADEIRSLCGVGPGLVATVAHLLAARDPLPADAALGHLRELRLLDAVRAEVLADRGSPARVAQLIHKQGGWLTLAPDDRRLLAGFLVGVVAGSGPAADVAAETLRAGWPDPIEDVLVADLRERPWDGALAEILRDRLTLVTGLAGPAAADGALAGVLGRPEAGRSGRGDARVVAVALDLPELGPRTLAAVAGAPGLAVELLSQVLARSRSAGADDSAEWLLAVLAECAGDAGWLRPLRVAVGAVAGPGRPEDVHDLVGAHPGAARLVLDLAGRRSRGDEAFALLAPALLALAGQQPDRLDVDLAGPAGFPVSAPANLAARDLITLAAEGSMPSLPGRAADLGSGYLEGLRRGWAQLVSPGADEAWWCRRLVAAVPVRRLGLAGVHVLVGIVDGAVPAARPAAAAVVAAVLEGARARYAAYHLDERWVAELPLGPRLAWYPPLRELGELSGGGAAETPVRDACLRALRHGGTLPEVLDALVPWFRTGAADRLVHSLVGLPDPAGRLLRELSTEILGGRYGSAAEAALRAHVSAAARQYTWLAGSADPAGAGGPS